MTFYVTMTDNFMSGWGEARNKTAKYVVECDDLKQAEQIERAANDRSEMRHVNVTQRQPYYPSNKYQVTTRHYSELGGAWHEIH